MTQVKAQTLQQKLGFQDKELSTPKHDEIMLWLDGWVDANLNKIIAWENVIVCKKGSKSSDDVLPASLGLTLPDIPSIKLQSKVWESPIVDRTYTIGFADMFVCYEQPHLRLDPDENSFQISLDTYDNRRMYFEVKPEIPSLGELIRQIRMYQTYTGVNVYNPVPAKWFVVSLDARFKEQLVSQRIGFIKATL